MTLSSYSTRLKRSLLLLLLLCMASVVYMGFNNDDATGMRRVIQWISPSDKSSATMTKEATDTRLEMNPSDKTPQPSASSQPHRLSREEIEQRFAQRRTLLKKSCERHRGSKAFKPLSFKPVPHVVSYRPLMNVTVMYCPIQKAASTTWGLLFKSIRSELRSRGHVEEFPLANGTHENRGVGRNRRSGASYRVKPEADLLSFLFVREPYGRLLSAWTDKLFSPNTLFWWSVGRHIVRNFRKNPSEHSLRCGHDVTFAEFVKYVIHSQKTGMFRDGHFVPTHDHCAMCALPYKYIGHVETLSEDMPFLLETMQSPVNSTKYFDKDTIRGNAGNGLFRMRAGVLQCIGLDEASRRVWKKLQIRGIISKKESFPLTPEQTSNITASEFGAVALAALDRSGDKPTRRRQKTEALKEAFASVPLSDKTELQKLLFLDFDMFGYDKAPDEVFPREPYVKDTTFSYFEL